MGSAQFPLALALVAGAVAAVNPCGFAMLPAYLALLVSGPGPEGAQAPRRVQVQRAATLSLAMTSGFAAVFGAFGLAVARLSVSIQQYLPGVTLGIGIVLIGMGVWLALGRHLSGVPALRRVGRAPGMGVGSQVLYGVGFAAASLSCAVGPFLAITTTAARTGDAAGVVLTYLTFAAGMGAVVTTLAIGVALARGSMVAHIRRATPLIERFSGLLLLAAGGYVAWYAWYEIRLQTGRVAADPVVAAATRLQARATQAVADLGPSVLAVVVGAMVLLVTALALTGRRGKVPPP